MAFGVLLADLAPIHEMPDIGDVGQHQGNEQRHIGHDREGIAA